MGFVPTTPSPGFRKPSAPIPGPLAKLLYVLRGQQVDVCDQEFSLGVK